MLQALLEEANLQPKDLLGIFKHEFSVKEVLQEKRQLTKRQLTKIEIEQLSHLFNISQKFFNS